MAHEHEVGANHRFCPACGSVLETKRVQGAIRPACPSCGFVHFRNPAVAAICVVVEDDRILLVRRAAGLDGEGMWSLPGGFVDADEDIRAAAVRELKEETGLDGSATRVIDVRSVDNDPGKPTVAVWFATTLVDGGVLQPGDDAEAASWFPLDDPPTLAFDGDAALIAGIRDGADPYARLADGEF